MSSFKDEIEVELRARFGASESKAEKIADLAARYKSEMDPDVTPEFLVKEMEKREKATVEGTWNSAIGFLYGPGYSTGEGKSNPYRL